MVPVVLMVLLGALTMAGCGGSGSAGSAIRVGFICSRSGAESSSLGRAADVANAWADSVNAGGGINGTTVKLFVEDDGLDPTTSLQDAKWLVEEDHVVAIVGDVSAEDTAWASYVAANGLPVVGGESVFPPFATNADFFAAGGSFAIENYATLKLGKQAGVSNSASSTVPSRRHVLTWRSR